MNTNGMVPHVPSLRSGDTHLHRPLRRLHVYTAVLVGRGPRKRQVDAKPAPPTRDRMARVAVADGVWSDFRALAGDPSIAQALGALVEREVERERARRVRADELDDQELVDALSRA